MKRNFRVVMSLALATVIDAAFAQAQQPSAAPVSPAAPVLSGPQQALSVLPGRWVRPDGGYVISIRGVDAGGPQMS